MIRQERGCDRVTAGVLPGQLPIGAASERLPPSAQAIFSLGGPAVRIRRPL